MKRPNIDRMKRHALGTKPWRGPRPRRSSVVYQQLLHHREADMDPSYDRHAYVAKVFKGLVPWPREVARPRRLHGWP
jgi:hypothetical protein